MLLVFCNFTFILVLGGFGTSGVQILVPSLILGSRYICSTRKILLYDTMIVKYSYLLRSFPYLNNFVIIRGRP